MQRAGFSENLKPGMVSFHAMDKALQPETLDLTHLRAMTFGDRGLQDEVLRLFLVQVRALREQLAGGTPDALAIHSIKGAARGVGAGQVAIAAERVEQAGAEAVEGLDAALVAAEAAIAAQLQSF